MSAAPAVLSPNPSSISEPEHEGWIIVDRTRRRSRGRFRLRHAIGDYSRQQNQVATSRLSPSDPTPWAPTDSIVDHARSLSMLRKIESTIDRLEKSKFYDRFLSSLNCSAIRDGLAKLRVSDSGLDLRPIRLVAYGIGSIESYPAPRLQLALLILLRRQLGADVACAEIFDPVLSATECHVIEQFGFKVVSTNEHGCRKVTPETPTLFFMPHCEAILYDSLLRTNWWPLNLRRMAIIGNSFTQYARYVSEAGDSIGSVKIQKVARCVLESRKFVKEIGLELERSWEEHSGLQLFQAFHDTSWHFFDVNDETDLVEVNG